MAKLANRQLQSPLNLTGSLYGTASWAEYVVNGGSGPADTSGLVTTSSFNAFTSSVVTTSSFNNFTSSVVTTSSFNVFTGSVVTTSSFNNFTSSVVATSSFNNFTGSVVATSSFNNATGSFATTGSNTFRGDQVITGSLRLSGSNIDFQARIDMSSGVIDGSGAMFLYPGNLGFFTYAYNDPNNNAYTIDGGDLTIQAGLPYGYSYPGVTIKTYKSGSVGEKQWHFDVDGKLTAPGAIQASSFTGSLQGTASWAYSASNYIESDPVYTAERGKYITTGSSGNIQTISGSLVILQDLTVLGSSSIVYVTSSQLDISTNIIKVNTATPAIRFGGLAVVDSGSFPIGSGSFLYDSVQDEFIFVHKGDGTNVTSSHFLVGPETYNDLGNEIYISANRILKSQGNEHITSSNITDTGTIVSINSDTQITGSLFVTLGITGSLQGTASLATNAVTSSYPIAVSGSTLYSVAPSSNIPSGNGLRNSILLGTQAGYQTTANDNIVIGNQAGYQATNAYSSSFIGSQAGFRATDANDSVFIGSSAGQEATTAVISVMIGSEAGYQANLNTGSVLVGPQSGYRSTDADYLVAVGVTAGYSASYASESVFLGRAAGFRSTYAYDSVFIGKQAGINATFAQNAIYIGQQAGWYSNSSHSIYLGYQAGYNADLGHNSILIGYRAGANPETLGAPIKENNIIIGTNITLAENKRNSINIGGIIFGDGVYNTVSGNPFSGSANGKIGINNPSPLYNLDVSGSGNYDGGLTVSSSLTTPLIYDNGATVILGGPKSSTSNGQVQISGSLGVGMAGGNFQIRPATNSDTATLTYIGTGLRLSHSQSVAAAYNDDGIAGIVSNVDNLTLLDVGRSSTSPVGRIKIVNGIQGHTRLVASSSFGALAWISTEGTGSIGIGVATSNTPAYKLDVSGSGREGSVRFQNGLTITGSLIVSGSSTLTNIGPAIFSGSVTTTLGFTGSLEGTATTASYINPTFISASAAASGFGSGGTGGGLSYSEVQRLISIGI